MKMIIVSGRSGSGKSTVLHVLEDLGYYCIDNLPVGLLFPLLEQATATAGEQLQKIAVSVDARNLSDDLANFGTIYPTLQEQQVDIEIVYLDADSQTLQKRFHATRRKHPLTNDQTSLQEAIAKEQQLLEPISTVADLSIDTSNMTMYELRDMIKQRVAGRRSQDLALLFQSFGYKHGVPMDADYVFDVRCLPNPYWDTSLRRYTGLDDPVKVFLESHGETQRMFDSIRSFIEDWLVSFQNSNRTYLTFSIGCTGGQHRSVYLTERLAKHFSGNHDNVQVRHKELDKISESNQK